MSKTASRVVPASDESVCCPPAADAATRQIAAGDEARTSTLVTRLKALADPTRLRMLELLIQHDTPSCVCEITPQFALHQPTISHHLRLLREAGLVDCERRGVWAYYWATEAGKRALVSLASLG
jgi:ArsR family transcriptional regulator, arsenate/arsenite/antimonite-responsive transcriptional repressor